MICIPEMPPLQIKNKKAVALKMCRLLQDEYGEPERKRVDEPLDILIQTILSQNTSDINSCRAFQNLRTRFPAWKSALAAPRSHMEDAIRSGGLAKVKAERIHRLLSYLNQTTGVLSLQFLQKMLPEQAMAFLSTFDGVGPKTTHCVMLFGCGMDVFPVDTHILRISKRVGLIEKSISLERAHGLWAQFLPANAAYALHVNLITHGRKICCARKINCLSCCLRRLCRYFLTEMR